MNLTVILIISVIINLLECIVFFRKKKPDGRMRINMTDPMKDTYTLELLIPLGELNTRSQLNILVIKED